MSGYKLASTGNYGGALFIGRSASPYGNLGALRDSNGRPMVYLAGNYPEITLLNEVASNGSHAGTIRFQTYVSINKYCDRKSVYDWNKWPLELFLILVMVLVDKMQMLTMELIILMEQLDSELPLVVVRFSGLLCKVFRFL